METKTTARSDDDIEKSEFDTSVDCQASFQPIGYLQSWFKVKNATPRQPSVCPVGVGEVTILKTTFTNPQHSVQDLQEFSHIWLIFLFNKNSPLHSTKAKVAPPRLNGTRVGVFATRSPHRPNPIGLTLAKLEKIDGSTLYVSGIDLLDGTPILDIKPFIPAYDQPTNLQDKTKSNDEIKEPHEVVRVPKWIDESSSAPTLGVRFTQTAQSQLEKFSADSADKSRQLQFLQNPTEARTAIEQILRADPRSIYRRNQCTDKLYYCSVDQLHVTCWFDNEENVVEVLKVKPNI